MRLRQTESLKAKLGIGAALLGGVTLVLAAILYLGMTRVADRLEAALHHAIDGAQVTIHVEPEHSFSSPKMQP